jgi:hypothetical protein
MGPAFTELEQRKPRIALLYELAAAFEDAQPAMVRCDIQKIQQHAARQHQLCRALLRLHENGPQAPAAGRAQQDEDLLALELEAMQARVRHLGRVQAALLRRSRRAMQIFARLLASSAVTYAPPAASAEDGK